MNLKSEYRIKIPATNGFVGRQCSDKLCRKYFQIHQSNIESELICPYCGEKNPIYDMWTESQANYARDIATEEIMSTVHAEIDKVLNNLGRSSGSNSMIQFRTKSTPYVKRSISAPIDKKIDSEIECSECQGKFQVYGIFGYCPLCKYENIKIYDANLAIIEREVDLSDNKDRALRHAYGDLVSSFENFCKKYSSENKSVNFQSLRNAKKYFKKQNDIDIYEGLTDSDKTKIKRVFMKRHVYVHSEGIITDQYVKEVPEDSSLFGEKAVLSKEELVEGAKILRDIINNIVMTKTQK